MMIVVQLHTSNIQIAFDEKVWNLVWYTNVLHLVWCKHLNCLLQNDVDVVVAYQKMHWGLRQEKWKVYNRFENV